MTSLSQLKRESMTDPIKAAYRIKELEKKLQAAYLLIDVLADPDPCSWDHNKNCQAHGCFNYNGTCVVDEAKKFLEAK